MIDREEIKLLCTAWLEIDINEKSRNEILALLENEDYSTLDKKLSKRISFGTAGLRSSVESGFAHMNDITVLQAAQGLVKYLLNHNEKEETLSVVIGYDHRICSQRFAELTASAAVSKGVKVYYLGSVDNLSKESIELSQSLFANNEKNEKGYVHTPLVPFAVSYKRASVGVMVTASHNPAKDNGYKVYYGNGCQIIPPVDEQIAQEIEKNLKPWTDSDVWNTTKHFTEQGHKLIVPIKQEVTEAYLKAVDGIITNKHLNFDFVYTPIHGIGFEIFEKVIKLFSNNGTCHVVEEQRLPDSLFATVKFPNPEEKGTLSLAIKNAESLKKKLILATDPDADRFSVVVKSQETDIWVQLTGNEIGFLFAMYLIEEVIPPEKLSQIYMVNSTVSSRVLESMAKFHGFKYTDTLTGFKWIGNVSQELKMKGFSVPFAYEEAIGYMFSVMDDKDGIAAAVVWLQLYEKWFANKKYSDPLDKLKQGYTRYGWFKERNGYYIVKDTNVVSKIFNGSIRQGDSRPGSKLGSDFVILSWCDLTTGYDSSTSDNKPRLPIDPKSQMITATLRPLDSSHTEAVRFTCRGSGTEPKLKIYIEGSSNHSGYRAQLLADLCWETLKTVWFKPEENDMEERS